MYTGGQRLEELGELCDAPQRCSVPYQYRCVLIKSVQFLCKVGILKKEKKSIYEEPDSRRIGVRAAWYLKPYNNNPATI